jgi:outer membrane protein assembly factor BamB
MIASVLLLLPATLSAQDWPQWRGPARTGVVTQFTAPAVWPKQLRRVWSTPVGASYSSPAVAAGAIFVFTRQGDQEVVQAIDRTSGKARWSKSYAAAFEKNKYATGMGKGPFSTPTFHQDKLITFGVTGVLSCWNASTGALLWRKDFSKRVDTTNLFTGTATSPLIDAGVLYVHMGDDRGGSLLALDLATGNQKWSWNGDGPSYSSPVLADVNGRRQLITLTTKHAVGLDPRNGELLWKIDFKDQWNENIVTPVVHGNRVIFSGVRRGTFALDISPSPKIAWENSDMPMYMTSPVLDGDALYGMSSKRKGALFCIDVRTGKLSWSTTGREGTNMSLVSAGPFLFALNETGDLKIIRRNAAKYVEVASYKVSENPTWSQPVVLNDGVLIKDEVALTLYSLK